MAAIVGSGDTRSDKHVPGHDQLLFRKVNHDITGGMGAAQKSNLDFPVTAGKRTIP